MVWRLPPGFPQREPARRRHDRRALRRILVLFCALILAWSALGAGAVAVLAGLAGGAALVAAVPVGLLPLLFAIHISSAPAAVSRLIDQPERSVASSVSDLFRPRTAWASPLRGMNPRARTVSLLHADRAGLDLAQAADIVRRWMELPDVPQALTADRRTQIVAGLIGAVVGLAAGFAGPWLVAPAIGGGVATYTLVVLLPLLLALFAVGGFVEAHRAVRVAWVLDVLAARQAEEDEATQELAARQVTTKPFAGRA